MSVSVLQPSRNLITFSRISEIDITICSTSLINVITELKPILEDVSIIDSLDKVEIRANDFNWSIRITVKSLQVEYVVKKCILGTSIFVSCVLLEINKIIHKQSKFKDILELEYHPLSFRQPDNTIRTEIITYFQNEFTTITNTTTTNTSTSPNTSTSHNKTCNTFVMIGGECTLFGKVLEQLTDKMEIYFLTDFKSIYNDLEWNYLHLTNDPERIKLINYKTCKIEWEKYVSSRGICIIANTGVHGLGKHLAKEITNSNAEIIYVVICNEISFREDYLILGALYEIHSKIEIKTNYSVCIYKLVLI
jgi:hypothetical protein